MKWSEILDQNWDSVVEAAGRAAIEASEGAYEVERRVLLSKDGKVSLVWEFPGTMTAGQRDGEERRICAFQNSPDYDPDYAQSWADGCEMDTPEYLVGNLLCAWRHREDIEEINA